MLLMRGVRPHHRAIVSHGLRGGVRAHGPETQLMLMMLVLTAENLVNTECFVGPRKNAPKIAGREGGRRQEKERQREGEDNGKEKTVPRFEVSCFGGRGAGPCR